MAEEKKNKRYFWLKLENTYFKRLDQRKMCKQKNGYDMQRIYLKMMLLAVDKGGYIPFQGVYDSIQEEIAEELFEDIELVNQTVEYAQKNKLLEMNELQIFLPQVLEMTGSETDSARRVRKHRESKLLSSEIHKKDIAKQYDFKIFLLKFCLECLDHKSKVV